MRRQLRDKRILITGASSGIGKALAERAARAGMRVVLCARSADKLEELAAQLRGAGRQAIAAPTDITSLDARSRLLETAKEAFGGLDLLVNNAGLGTHGLFSESSEEELRRVMEVNFFAPAELIRQAISLLKEGQQPAVVNVASMTGRRAMPFWSEYSASKYALCGLTEALRGELARFDIDVLLICPGLTATNLDHNLLRDNGKMIVNFRNGMKPDHVAAVILKAIHKNRTETVVGWEARGTLLADKFLPRIVDGVLKQIVRRVYR
ncbi:MAG: SDR family oxidoreductase [Gemmataceae bacterium]